MSENPFPELPPYVVRFLRWICPDYLLEEIEGDLLQRFAEDSRAYTQAVAKRRLIWNTMRYFRPGIVLRNSFRIHANQLYMVENYLRIMFRNLLKQKVHSLINVFGLTAGITFAITLGVFIYQEWQVNAGINDVDDLYFLETKYDVADDGAQWTAPGALLAHWSMQHPNKVQSFYRFWDRQVTVTKGDKHFRVQSMIGDSTFQHTFQFPVLFGDALRGLDQPNTIIITEKIARQYFDRSDVVGETLELKTELSGKKEFKVTAVLADLQRKNSVSDFMNMDAQIFIPLSNRGDFTLGDPESWTSSIINYVRLAPGTNPIEVEKELTATIKAHAETGINVKCSMDLRPIRDYYFETNNGAIKKLMITLSIMSGLILLLAIANFVNITLASSISRLKEVGLRKVIGGRKIQITFQFLVESIVLALISGTIGIVGYELLRDYFTGLFGVTLMSVSSFPVVIWAIIVAGFVAIGLIAGLYPAVYLATSQTVESLKGKLKSVKGTLNISRGLISAQFLIAGSVSVVALVMSRQVDFFMEKDMGYDRSFVLSVTSVPRLWTPEGFTKMDVARQKFESSNAVKAVSLSWGAPGNFSPMSAKSYLATSSADAGVQTAITWTDESYHEVFGLNLVEGKYFENGTGAHVPRNVILNESAKRAIGATLGDKIKFDFDNNTEFTVIGIIKDFNYESLHQAVKPLAITHVEDFNSYRYFSFKMNSRGVGKGVAELETIWKEVFPDDPFVYQFIDDKLADFYRTEMQLKKASSSATVLMMIIVITGVMGLVSLNVSKRSKEIAIRKVLGASSSNLIFLISKEYMLLMCFAFALAMPLSYYFIQQWLNGFAYRIDLAWWMFTLPVAALFALTLFLIGSQSLKTIHNNPVDSIKYE
jgi:putative ABC transport system permease protein